MESRRHREEEALLLREAEEGSEDNKSDQATRPRPDEVAMAALATTLADQTSLEKNVTTGKRTRSAEDAMSRSPKTTGRRTS